MFRRKSTWKRNKPIGATGRGPTQSRQAKRDWTRHIRFEALEDRYLLSAAPTPLGPQFQVNQDNIPGGAYFPAIASDAAGDRVVVWQNDISGVYAQRYSASGAALGSQFQVAPRPSATPQPFPVVAMDSAGDFVVAWQSSAGQNGPFYIEAQRYNPAGVAQGSNFIVDTSTSVSQNPSVAMDSSGDFVVAFNSVNGEDVYAQRYSAAGAPQGSEFLVNTYTTGAVFAISTAMDSVGDFVVAWDTEGLSSHQTGIVAQRFNAGGVAQGSEFLVNTYTTGSQAQPTAAMDSSGDFVIAWLSNGEDGSAGGVYAQRYNAAGAVQGSEFQVNTYTTGDQSRPSVAMDSAGDFVVTWQSYGTGGSGDGVYAQAYTSAGTASGSQLQFNSDATSPPLTPAVAMDSAGDFAVAWMESEPFGGDIYAQAYRGNFSASAVGSEFQVNTYTTGNQLAPKVATDAVGDYVVVWQSGGQDGSGYGVFAQRYSAAGVAQGNEFQVNTYTTSDQMSPAVAMDSAGDFVVTWTSRYQDGGSGFSGGYGVYAQRYNAAGTAQGSEFRVNTYTTGKQTAPSVAMDSAGDFAVDWTSNGEDGSGGVYAQRYNAAGVAQGSEFQVNSYTSGSQDYGLIAMDSAGDFVIAWDAPDGSPFPPPFFSYGVFAQRYNAAGVAEGSEFQVNTYTTGLQVVGSVAMDSAGDFVIAWGSLAEDGSEWDSFAQRYDASGSPQGGQFPVNTYTAGSGVSPSVAMDAAGDFVVTWGSRGEDGSAYGIYAQRYNALGAAQGSEFRVNTYTTGSQNFPSVATDRDGDFIIAWGSSGQDGSGYGVYAQRYAISPQQSPSPISQQGTTLTIDGAGLVGPFLFEFESATSFDFTYNGTTYYYDTSTVNHVIFNGVLGGATQATFYDSLSTNAYAATQTFYSTTLTRTDGVNFEFDANDVADFYAYVSDPASTATVNVAGGSGANYFVDAASGDYSYIADPIQGIYSELSGFGSETVTGSSGSTYAYVYSTSNASFIGDPGGSFFTVGGAPLVDASGTIPFDAEQPALDSPSSYTGTLTGFPQEYVVGASDGTDSVTLHALHTAGGSFVGTPTFSSVSGTFNGQPFLIGALYAANVTAQATNPTDSAFFYSSAGDTFNGTTGFSGSTLTGSASGFANFSTFVVAALGFQSVTVAESGTGTDVANLTSPGNGTFISTPTVSTLAVGGVTVFTVLTSIPDVITAGGSSSTVFLPVPSQVNVTGNADGTDTGYLYDGAGSNALVAQGSTGTLTRAINSVIVSQFGNVLAYQTQGTDDTVSEQAVDFTLQLYGDWTHV